MKNFGMILLVVTCLNSCARSADMVPLNDIATQLGTPTVDFTAYGTGYGPVTVTLPSGEVLNGHYRVAVGGSISTGFATSFSRRGVSSASATGVSTALDNPFSVQVVGIRGTTMTCHGSAGGFGHGDALCETNNGAQYQLMF